MVGFNRRFAPMVRKIKSLIVGKMQPCTFIITVNAGAIPKDHWTQDSSIGGGRIIGEVCHFIDLLRFLAGSEIVYSHAINMLPKSNTELNNDIVTISLKFKNGSIGTIHYFANGSNKYPKERIEVFCDGSILQLNNYRSLIGYGWKGFSKMKSMRQDKGHNGSVQSFLNAIDKGDKSPISFEEIIEVSKTTIEIAKFLE